MSGVARDWDDRMSPTTGRPRAAWARPKVIASGVLRLPVLRPHSRTFIVVACSRRTGQIRFAESSAQSRDGSYEADACACGCRHCGGWCGRDPAGARDARSDRHADQLYGEHLHCVYLHDRPRPADALHDRNGSSPARLGSGLSVGALMRRSPRTSRGLFFVGVSCRYGSYRNRATAGLRSASGDMGGARTCIGISTWYSPWGWRSW